MPGLVIFPWTALLWEFYILREETISWLKQSTLFIPSSHTQFKFALSEGRQRHLGTQQWVKISTDQSTCVVAAGADSERSESPRNGHGSLQPGSTFPIWDFYIRGRRDASTGRQLLKVFWHLECLQLKFLKTLTVMENLEQGYPNILPHVTLGNLGHLCLNDKKAPFLT